MTYEDIAQAALEQYDIAPGKPQFLGHSANVAFRIETPRDNFLLRIHQPLSSSHIKSG